MDENALLTVISDLIKELNQYKMDAALYRALYRNDKGPMEDEQCTTTDSQEQSMSF